MGIEFEMHHVEDEVHVGEPDLISGVVNENVQVPVSLQPKGERPLVGNDALQAEVE